MRKECPAVLDLAVWKAAQADRILLAADKLGQVGPAVIAWPPSRVALADRAAAVLVAAVSVVVDLAVGAGVLVADVVVRVGKVVRPVATMPETPMLASKVRKLWKDCGA